MAGSTAVTKELVETETGGLVVSMVKITIHVNGPPAPPEGCTITGFSLREEGRWVDEFEASELHLAVQGLIRRGTYRTELRAIAEQIGGYVQCSLWDAVSERWGKCTRKPL